MSIKNYHRNFCVGAGKRRTHHSTRRDNLEEHCRFWKQLSKAQGEEDVKGFLRFFCQKLVKKGRNLAVKTFLLSWSVMRDNTAERAPSGVGWNKNITTPHRAGLELWLRPSWQESPCCSRQEQAAISNQDFSITTSSMASAALPRYLWGSLKPMDSHWQTSLSYRLISILFYPCWEKKSILLNSTGIMATAHRAGDCQQTLVPRVNYWEMIISLAPEGKGGTSQPRKLLVYQGSSLVLPERFLSKQSSNQPSTVTNLYWVSSKVWIK